jgi:hypothetical protein
MINKDFTLIILFLFLAPQLVWAQVPEKISYQGMLINNEGYLFSDNNYDGIKNSEWHNNIVPYLIQNVNSDDTIVVDYLIGTLADGGRSRQTYTYDKNVNRTSFALDYWENGEWIPYWLQTYTYDLEGNLSAELHKNWDGTELVNSLRRQFTSDTNNNMISDLYETWDGTQWITASLYTYTYNFSGIMTSQLFQRWDGSKWISNRRETYTHDFNGNRISELWEIKDGDQMVNYWRGTTIYDPNGNKISGEGENWDGSQWVIYSRYSAIYDTNNNLLSELYENMDGSQWRNNQKMTYTYDSNSNMISSLFEVWHGYWDPASRKTYVYDSYGRMILGLGERWWENKWQPYDQWFEVKDNFGNISSAIATTINIFYSFLTDNSDPISVKHLFSLSQNYPNPFNPTTTIKYSIKNQSSVVLKIYDLLGKEVAVLVNEQQSAGNYEVFYNAKDLVSGVYFYRIIAENLSLTKKMLLLE